jgi:UDP:flavonoid glycosyltransferase YjiC (YdhE family)
LRKAVPPNPADFVESTGLAAVAYGPDSHEQMDDDFARNVWKMQNPISLVRGFKQYNAPGEAEVSAPLTSLTDGADLLLTGMNYEGFAANVAGHYDIPLASLHTFPSRASGHLLPILPSPLIRSTMRMAWWLSWRITKEADDTQRRELGLPKATGPLSRRITERGSLGSRTTTSSASPGRQPNGRPTAPLSVR